MTILLVAIGAIVGAPLRYVTDWVLGRWHYLPWGTLAVNGAAYSALIGYFGGRAFENQPIKGLLLGLGVALVLGLLIELIRRIAAKRRAKAEAH